MSNLFKSKFLIGAMVVTVMLAGFAFVVNTPSAAAASCSITSTLRVGSKGPQVVCLQTALGGLTADGNFGPKTKAAVVAWQKTMGLVPDGIFGAKSRAAWSGTTVTPPSGCLPGYLYDPVTAQPCTGAPVVQSGPVTAMLSVSNPAPGTLVAGQATADLAHFAFTGSGTVTNVTLQRIGVSADTTPSNVYLFNGATRLTDAAAVASTGLVTFNVPGGLFTVNGAVDLSVKSDIAASTSGQTVGFKLVSFATSAGTITANLSGNIHTVASATLATVAAGTVTPTAATIDPAPAVTVWQSTLTIANRDVNMKRLSLRNLGSAPAASFANFKLFVSGVQVGTATGVDANGYVTFDLTAAPVKLVSGARVVRVDADIVSGSSRTFQFSLRNAADVDFVDSSFGVNISPTSTPWTAGTANTISGSSGGTLTIAKDVSSPSINLVNAASDAVIGVFKLTAYGEAIKLETIRATFTASDGNITQLRNGRLLINGVQYGSTATLNEDSHGTLAYTSYTLNYTVVPGSPVLLEMRADIVDNDGTDSITAGTDTINATIAAGSTNAQRVDSLGSFSSPASAVASNTLLIASTAITLSKNATYTNQNTTLPVNNFKIGSWNLAGSSTEGVLLSTLSFDVDEANATTEFDEGDMTNIYVVVKKGGTVVAQPTPLSTGSTGADLNFSINYTLPVSQNVTIELYADLADDTLDKVAGVSGGTNAIDASDAFVTDLTVTGTSNSGTAITATSADTAGQTIAYEASTLVATVDASSPAKGITYDNQTVTSAAYKFTSTTSAFTVTDVTLTMADATTVVENVMLYDGSTLLANGTQPGGTSSVVFSGLNFAVPANQSKVLTVKVQLGTVGVSAGTSESSLATTLTVFTSVTGGVSDASANDSGQSQENNPASAVTSVFAAIPVITNIPLSDVILRNGSETLLKFTITGTGGDIAWAMLYFDTAHDTDTALATDATTGVSLVDVATGVPVAGVFTNAGNIVGAVDLTGSIKFVPTAEQVVSGSKTYELRGTVTSANADGDYVTATLANDSTSAVVALDDATTIIASGDTDAPIVWSDLSAASHTVDTVDWTTDFGVRNLPISGSLNF